MRSRLAQLSKSKAVLIDPRGARGRSRRWYDGRLRRAQQGRDPHARRPVPTQVSAIGGTVGDVLAAEGIEVTDKDLVAPVDRRAGRRRHAPSPSSSVGRSSSPSTARRRTYWVNSTDVASALGEIGRRFDGADLSVSRGASIGRTGLSLDVVTPKVLAVKIGAKDLKKRKVTALTVADVLESIGRRGRQARQGHVRRSTTEIADGDKVVVTDIRVATKQGRRARSSTPASSSARTPRCSRARRRSCARAATASAT